MRARIIVLVGLVLFFLGEAIAASLYDWSSYRFCWTRECVAFALREFSLLFLQIPSGAIAIVGFFVTLSNLNTAQHSLHASNAMVHMQHFQAVVQKRIDDLEYLRDVPVSFPLLHSAAFPDLSMFPGNAAKALRVWIEHTKQASETVQRLGLNSFRAVNHRRILEPLMKQVGIGPGDVENDLFLRIEADCYRLLDFVCELGGSVPPRPANVAYLVAGDI